MARHISVLLLLVLLAGCSKAPAPAKVEPASTAKAFTIEDTAQLSEPLRTWWETYHDGEISAWMTVQGKTYILLAGGTTKVSVERVDKADPYSWMVYATSGGPTAAVLVSTAGAPPPHGSVEFIVDGQRRPVLYNDDGLPPAKLTGDLVIVDVAAAPGGVQFSGYGHSGSEGVQDVRILDSTGRVVGQGIFQTALGTDWGSFVQTIPVSPKAASDTATLEAYVTSMRDDAVPELVFSMQFDLSPP